MDCNLGGHPLPGVLWSPALEGNKELSGLDGRDKHVSVTACHALLAVGDVIGQVEPGGLDRGGYGKSEVTLDVLDHKVEPAVLDEPRIRYIAGRVRFTR